ncbi:MAG: hypothetical protein L7F78_18015, partial [Syntrophales bacterium LBB04]|nr:hypothetical protein [Syntrophales bacterium LBB04]
MKKAFIIFNLIISIVLIPFNLFAARALEKPYSTDNQQSQPEGGESLIFCWHLPHFHDGSGGLDWIAPDYKSVRSQYTVMKASSIKEALDEGCDVFIKTPGPTPDNAEVYSVYSKRRLLDVPNLHCMGFSSSTYHTCAKILSRKIFESFDAGTSNYQKVIAERDQYQKRQLPTASKLPDIPSPPFTIKSDVDEIPSMNMKINKSAYAIIIGIEQYRQKLPNADFAVSDAK